MRTLPGMARWCPFRVGRIERHPALPILRVGIGVEYLGAGIALAAAVEEAAPGAGDRIKAVAIGERRIGIRRRDLFLVLQAGPANELRETRVDLDADRADMGIQDINDLAMLLILAVRSRILPSIPHVSPPASP